MKVDSACLFVLVVAHSASLCCCRKLTNITIYRLTPLNYTGVTNMDTGDAAGDAMFGLNQLLLPQLCPVEPSFVWCANRQYLSGSSAHMVYTEFVVESDAQFGEYNPCNPNNETGIFACKTYNDNSDTPRQCAAGFEMYNEDCLNGTVFASFVTSSDWAQAEGDCCEHCSRAGSQCAGWNVGPKHQVGHLGAVRTCDLMQGSTMDWRGAQATHDCKAAVRDPSSFACWYANPEYNTSFSKLCDPHRCACDVIDQESVGREQHAMCWNHSKAGSASMHVYDGLMDHSKWFDYISRLACLLDGTWYSTQAKGECSGSTADEHCWWRVAETRRTVDASCVNDRMVASVQTHRPQCWEACPQPSNRSSTCYLECLFETILGNQTSGIPALTREQVTAPFVQALKTEHEGGCPQALCHSDVDCRLSGDTVAHCKDDGWCRCDDGFSGQFCTRSQVYVV